MMQDFTGVFTVRKSINFVYAGTEVHLQFKLPGVTKQKLLLGSAFKKSQQVERFIQELYSIIKIKY